jgi:hypothetical protein
LTSPTNQYPIGYTTHAIITTNPVTPARLVVNISPLPNSVNINCLFRPVNPVWGFTIGTLGQYTYNATTSTNFELDISEQTNIITNVLKYCGIIIKDPEIVQSAQAEAQQTSNNEKS